MFSAQEDDWELQHSSTMLQFKEIRDCHGWMMLSTVGIVHVSWFNIYKQSSKNTCRGRFNKEIAKNLVKSWWIEEKVDMEKSQNLREFLSFCDWIWKKWLVLWVSVIIRLIYQCVNPSLIKIRPNLKINEICTLWPFCIFTLGWLGSM